MGLSEDFAASYVGLSGLCALFKPLTSHFALFNGHFYIVRIRWPRAWLFALFIYITNGEVNRANRSTWSTHFEGITHSLGVFWGCLLLLPLDPELMLRLISRPDTLQLGLSIGLASLVPCLVGRGVVRGLIGVLRNLIKSLSLFLRRRLCVLWWVFLLRFAFRASWEHGLSQSVTHTHDATVCVPL